MPGFELIGDEEFSEIQHLFEKSKIHLLKKAIFIIFQAIIYLIKIKLTKAKFLFYSP